MMRFLVVTSQFYPEGGKDSALAKTIDSLLGRGHHLSVLAKDGTADGADERLAIRHHLGSGGMIGAVTNYLVGADVSEVAMPDLCLAWDFKGVGAGAIRAASHYGAPLLVALTPELKGYKPLGVDYSHAFATDAKVRDELAGSGLPVADAPVFSLEEVTSVGDAFYRFVSQVRLETRFERYQHISKYKQNPRSFMREA